MTASMHHHAMRKSENRRPWHLLLISDLRIAYRSKYMTNGGHQYCCVMPHTLYDATYIVRCSCISLLDLSGTDLLTPRGAYPFAITINQSNAIAAELQGQKFNMLDASLASSLAAELHQSAPIAQLLHHNSCRLRSGP